MCEALDRLRWNSFLEWINDQSIDFQVDQLMLVVHNFRDAISGGAVNELLETEIFQQALGLYSDFIKGLEGLPKFCSEYNELVQLLLLFIRAAREQIGSYI